MTGGTCLGSTATDSLPTGWTSGQSHAGPTAPGGWKVSQKHLFYLDGSDIFKNIRLAKAHIS